MSQAPKFGVDSTVPLRPVFAAKGFSSSEPFKMFDPPPTRPARAFASPSPPCFARARSMFSFADDRFATPWITLWDGEGAFAEELTITFVYSGNDVRRIRWESKSASHGVRVSANAAPQLIYTFTRSGHWAEGPAGPRVSPL